MIDQLCFNEILLDSAKEVFETMVFMDIEQSPDPVLRVEDEAILGSITFKGDLNGCLSICCNETCARMIGINMLGIEVNDPISRADIFDAIGEVSNMVMGSLKTRIQKEMDNISVSIPTVINGRNMETNLGEGSAKKAVVKALIDSEYVAEFKLLYKEKS